VAVVDFDWPSVDAVFCRGGFGHRALKFFHLCQQRIAAGSRPGGSELKDIAQGFTAGARKLQLTLQFINCGFQLFSLRRRCELSLISPATDPISAWVSRISASALVHRLGERLIARVGLSSARLPAALGCCCPAACAKIERQADHLQSDLAMVVEIERVDGISVQLLFDGKVTIPIDGLIQVPKHLLRVGCSGLVGRLVGGRLRKQQAGQDQQARAAGGLLACAAHCLKSLSCDKKSGYNNHNGQVSAAGCWQRHNRKRKRSNAS